MTRRWEGWPWLAVVAAVAAMAWHGPIPQLAGYHAFADTRHWMGVANAGDVLSNLAFVAVAAWAWATEDRAAGEDGAQRRARAAFIASLFLTALGSIWYHLAPDNQRLFFDRVPIALACASLLCLMHARASGRASPGALPAMLLAAIASVVWWSRTEAMGAGDLRPYLLLQFAPLVLVPLWQWQYGRPREERVHFGIAIALYVAAKALELADHAVLDALAVVSGHALKHVAAAVAAVFIVKASRGRRPA
jgi:hypothetical protein